jgi:protein-tyrosine-phosphatase
MTGSPGAGRPEVLLVCVHDAGRSQMAAALLGHHARGPVRGTDAGEVASVCLPVTRVTGSAPA